MPKDRLLRSPYAKCMAMFRISRLAHNDCQVDACSLLRTSIDPVLSLGGSLDAGSVGARGTLSVTMSPAMRSVGRMAVPYRTIVRYGMQEAFQIQWHSTRVRERGCVALRRLGKRLDRPVASGLSTADRECHRAIGRGASQRLHCHCATSAHISFNKNSPTSTYTNISYSCENIRFLSSSNKCNCCYTYC